MILIALILAAIGLTAFTVVVIGVRATERRQSLNDPSRDGRAARFARWVLGARACPLPPSGDHREDRAARRERVRA